MLEVSAPQYEKPRSDSSIRSTFYAIELIFEDLPENTTGVPHLNDYSLYGMLLTADPVVKEIVKHYSDFVSYPIKNNKDETLNSMSPPVGEGMGSRAAVEFYDVSTDVRA